MRSLRELESGAAMEIPRRIGAAIKAWSAGTATPEQQSLSYRFVVEELAGVNRLGFALPDDPAVMGWRQGRRFVGLQIAATAATPITDPDPEPEPPAKTMTEKARRRAKKSATT